ncbi:MAG: cytochrome c3 family protein [Blastocatellia bacterium]
MPNRNLKIVILLTCALISLGVVTARPAVIALATAAQPTAPASPGAAPAQAAPDYGKFTHKSHAGAVRVPGTNQTRNLDCAYCHERNASPAIAQVNVATTKRNERLQLKFPGHKACTECHVQQFTTQPMKTCAICHDDGQALTTRPPQRDFPRRYDFNAFFDAGQHAAHVGYKMPDGKDVSCAQCHKPRKSGMALSIPVHNDCFACHAPGSGDAKAAKKSDCMVCHTQMTDNPGQFAAKYTSRAWGAQFTHRRHAGELGIACSQCHNINGSGNQPVPTSVRTKQHLGEAERGGRGCFSCHDGGSHAGRTVFSGEDFNACDKCHQRPDKKVVPIQG